MPRFHGERLLASSRRIPRHHILAPYRPHSLAQGVKLGLLQQLCRSWRLMSSSSPCFAGQSRCPGWRVGHSAGDPPSGGDGAALPPWG